MKRGECFRDRREIKGGERNKRMEKREKVENGKERERR